MKFLDILTNQGYFWGHLFIGDSTLESGTSGHLMVDTPTRDIVPDIVPAGATRGTTPNFNSLTKSSKLFWLCMGTPNQSGLHLR